MVAGRKWLYGVVALAASAMLVSAVGLYLTLSSRIAPEAAVRGAPATAATPATPQNAAPAATAPSLEIVAERLAQRLKDKDGTGEDWALLARTYVNLKRYPEAADAFAKALEKMPGNKDFIAGQAAARKAAAEAAPAR
jgi:cytochrome c-type biogenesis protein CcmH